MRMNSSGWKAIIKGDQAAPGETATSSRNMGNKCLFHSVHFRLGIWGVCGPTFWVCWFPSSPAAAFNKNIQTSSMISPALAQPVPEAAGVCGGSATSKVTQAAPTAHPQTTRLQLPSLLFPKARKVRGCQPTARNIPWGVLQTITPSITENGNF